MTTRTATYQAKLNGSTTVVALPPSDLDPAEDEMRVYVDGVLFIREYDPDLEQP